MSTKSITEGVVNTISRGPLVIFVLLALAIWQASKMTDQQIMTLEKLVCVLNNPVGFGLLFLLILFSLYAGLIWPSGKFLARFATEIVELQKEHRRQLQAHVEASKGLFHLMTAVSESCREIHEKIDKFYGNG